MARQMPLTSLKQINEINLTPLMDLTFILLITFIITVPLIEQGIPVNLPKGKAADLTPEKAQTVSVDHDGQVFLDDVPVTLQQLEERMTHMMRTTGDVTVMVRADEMIRYGVLVQVLRVLNQAQISKMALVTQAEE
jgi:biopolymer transport protein ExbD